MQAVLYRGEVPTEIVEILRPDFEIGELLGDQREEPGPNVAARAVLPDPQEVPDPGQRQAEALGGRDEADALDVVVVVAAVPARGALRGQQTLGFVVAQRRGRELDPLGELGDAVADHDGDGRPSSRVEGQA